MPELPEVETTRRGILPHLENQTIEQITIRQKQLRWPIPDEMQKLCPLKVHDISRRSKYLLITTNLGTIIIHLGMSGSLRVVAKNTPTEKHDHVDFILSNKQVLRYRDPRRFGCILWTHEPPEKHHLLTKLGPEPLSTSFNSQYLQQTLSKRQRHTKQAIMDAHIVVGVGNIYASESLYLSGIHPLTPCSTLTEQQISSLVKNIKQVLRQAIKAGGTTLKDFTKSDGKPGYFRHQLQVYARAGEPCYHCQHPVEKMVIGNRASFYCPSCQPLGKPQEKQIEK